tara:strand:- start:615 stop:875 length:261 start_codon:yes stop_codon:yes gene_type:complete
MSEAFTMKWGVNAMELETAEDPKQAIIMIALTQLVCILAVLYIVKPNFVMQKQSFGALECFYWPSALSIAVLIAVITYLYPYIMRR